MKLEELALLYPDSKVALKSTMYKTDTATVSYSVGDASHHYLYLKVEEGSAKANKFLKDLVEYDD